MAVLNNSALVGASGKGGIKAITTPQRSLRFNSADSAYLSRQFTSAGNQQTWTFSCWLKRGKVNDTGEFTIFGTPLSNNFQVYFGSTLGAYADKLQIGSDPAGYYRVSNAVFRDPSAWYHFVFTLDTTNAVANDRLKVWVNGAELTWQINNVISPGANLDWNSARQHNIGRRPDLYFDGYLANIHFIDGQALDPSAFAYTDPATGRWEPKVYAGSYSGNSFYLDFSDNSAATATTLGKDRSGLNNNWVPNNMQVSGVVYSNFMTGNGNYVLGFDGNPNTAITNNVGVDSFLQFAPTTPITITSSCLFKAGNNASDEYAILDGVEVPLTGTGNQGNINNLSAFVGKTISASKPFRYENRNAGQGCWWYYLEIDGVQLTNGSPAGIDSLRDHPVSAGIDGGLGGQVSGNYCTWNAASPVNATYANGNLEVTPGDNGRANATMSVSSGKWYWEATLTATSNTPSYNLVGIGDISDKTEAGVTSTSWTYRDDGKKLSGNSAINYGTSYAVGDVIGVAWDADNGTLTFYKNGSSQGQAYSGISGNYGPIAGRNSTYTATYAFNFGQRAFAYTAPSGFKALCDQNLPTPQIIKSANYFDVKTYTGNGATQTVSGLSFGPDWVWIKKRNAAESHVLWDTVRGATKAIYSESTSQELTSGESLTAFNSDGFTYGPNGAGNALNDTYVAWMWDAGDSAPSPNNNGTIQSTVKASNSSGFSVVTYTGNATQGASVGHGLSVPPSMIIIKNRSSSGPSWAVGHTALGGWNKVLYLNRTDAAATQSEPFNGTTPTSTVFQLWDSSATNSNGANYVAYCFAAVSSFSAFGSYVGNGSTDGPMITTGHRSRWILIKRTDTASNWQIRDTSRPAYNENQFVLFSNLANAEATSSASAIDILSNGFKIRGTSGDTNASGGTYIYCSFAESPFKYARAR